MKKIATIILCIAGCAAIATAQNNKVSSVVLSSQNGEAVSGASVTVTGSNISTTTDINGRFSIEAPAQYKTLTISHRNFNSATMNILPAPIVMEPARRFLDGWGVELGYVSSTISYEDSEGLERSGAFALGVTYDCPIRTVANLSVLGGLFYIPKGVDTKDDYGYVDVNYVELQATAKYKYYLPVLDNELNVFALAGPYVSYGVSGDYVEEYDGERYEESAFDFMDRWDAGLVLGLGLNYRNYSLTFRYGMGLVDVGLDGGNQYNRTNMFTLGYSF